MAVSLAARIAAIAVLALGVLGVDAYTACSTGTYNISESDRVSPSQRIARDYDIVADRNKPFPYINMYVYSKANVFVTYAENASASNTTVGKVKVSGTSLAAVDYVDFNGDPEPGYLDISFEVDPRRLVPTDAYLIEIVLYRKQTLKHFVMSGKGAAVLLDNVVYASQNASDSGSLRVFDESKLFVVDPQSTVTADIIGSDFKGRTSTMQIDVAGFNTAGGVEIRFEGREQAVTLFVDKLSDVTMLVKEDTKGSPLCVASSTPVNVTAKTKTANKTYVVDGPSRVISAGSPCTKLPIPKKELAFIDPRRAAEAAATTPAPSATATPTSAANIQQHSAMALTSVAVAIVLAHIV